MPDKKIVLEINNGEFGYSVGETQEMVASVSKIKIYEKEIVALIGKSGCGKTTILNTINGMAELLKGSVSLNGSRSTDNIRKQYIARTLQHFPMFHWLTVIQNLELAKKIRGITEDIDLYKILERFSVSKLKNRYPTNLSGGERSRCSLAQALIGKPKLILLDEPFSGLDSITKEEIATQAFDLAQEISAGVLFVTHDLYDACMFAQHAIILGGKPTRIVGEIDIAKTQNPTEKIRKILRKNEYA